MINYAHTDYMIMSSQLLSKMAAYIAEVRGVKLAFSENPNLKQTGVFCGLILSSWDSQTTAKELKTGTYGEIVLLHRLLA